MRKFFARNLDTRGRLVRGAAGSALVIAGVLVCGQQTWLGVTMIGSGGFVLYEAVRGWCVMRACGIKTRI